jgi:glycosyltransferase involved in cell wall biosynthesis
VAAIASTPTVSVLLPVFNAAGTLEPCLRSIRRQTLADFECLVVDDGSTDRSAEIAAGLVRDDPRFRLIARPHQGLVATLDAGIDLCAGRVVARMDADDLMHRERLAAQLAALDDDASLAAVGCGVRLWPRRALTGRRRDYERWLNALSSAALVARDAFVECPVAHPSLMIRRDVLRAFRYRDQGWAEDYDLVLRLLAAGLGVGSTPRRLLLWRDRPDRLSRVDPRYGLDRFTACKAHFLASGFLARSEGYVLWGYGSTGRTLRRALAAHGKRPTHIVEIKRGRIGQRIHGGPVVAPEALRDLRDTPLVVSVAFDGPRREIREWLRAHGFDEGRDFVCAA